MVMHIFNSWSRILFSSLNIFIMAKLISLLTLTSSPSHGQFQLPASLPRPVYGPYFSVSLYVCIIIFSWKSVIWDNILLVLWLLIPLPQELLQFFAWFFVYLFSNLAELILLLLFCPWYAALYIAPQKVQSWTYTQSPWFPPLSIAPGIAVVLARLPFIISFPDFPDKLLVGLPVLVIQLVVNFHRLLAICSIVFNNALGHKLLYTTWTLFQESLWAMSLRLPQTPEDNNLAISFPGSLCETCGWLAIFLLLLWSY